MPGSGFVWNQLTPAGARLARRIGGICGVSGRIATVQASSPDKAKSYQMHARYETDDGFRNELFSRFLSPALLAQYQQTKKKGRRPPYRANRPPAAPPRPPDVPATAVLTVRAA